jgi:hypothetical protein
MATKKKAMVQPVPARAADLPIFADPALQLRLIKTLQKQGNDRAYTVLEYHQAWASVHFEGDLEPKTITYR